MDVKVITDPYQTKYCVFFELKIIGDYRVTLSPEHLSYKWVGVGSAKDLIFEDGFEEIVSSYLSN